jgi:GTPase SAR1 family protein
MNQEMIEQNKSKINQLALLSEAHLAVSRVKILADFLVETSADILNTKFQNIELNESELKLCQSKLEEFYQLLSKIIEG